MAMVGADSSGHGSSWVKIELIGMFCITVYERRVDCSEIVYERSSTGRRSVWIDLDQRDSVYERAQCV